MSTDPRPTANSRALWLEPSPSGRRGTRQCTTRPPTARAAGSSRAMLGRASRRASWASAASPASGPTTAPCNSWVTIAVCAGLISSASGGVTPGSRQPGRRPGWCDLVELLGPFTQRHIGFRIDSGQGRVLDVLLVAPDLQIVPHGHQVLLLGAGPNVIGRHVGRVPGIAGPPDRIEHVGVFVVDRGRREDQPMVRGAL